MGRTYAEAQYSTPAAMRMILDCWLGPNRDSDSIENVARYMNKTLRIGGLKDCRALVLGAICFDKQPT